LATRFPDPPPGPGESAAYWRTAIWPTDQGVPPGQGRFGPNRGLAAGAFPGEMAAMTAQPTPDSPTLTRRRDRKARGEAWRIFYGDIHVGSIAERSGNPVGTDQWSWRCGFYPGSNPGEASYGTAASFDAARTAFESAWSVFLSKRTEADFLEYRRHREAREEIAAKRARGEKLEAEIPSSLMRCVCGVTFDSHKPAESYDHRCHIYAAQAQDMHW
jgi:hypothetical protein